MLQSFLKPLYHDIKTLVLDTLFPIYCLACEEEGPQFICDDCAAALTRLPRQFCIACQKPSVGGLTHPACQSPQTADGLISIYDYHDEKVANILIKGKYSFLPDVYKQLGIILADAIKKDFPVLLTSNIYNLTPVPLHWMRQRWRGFNQSEILANEMAKELGLKFSYVLERKKFTKTQKNLKKEQRIKNVESAFAIAHQYFSPQAWGDALSASEGQRGRNDSDTNGTIKNQNFLLIDDVTTTGNTLLEAAKVLKRNGAQKVFCLTAARD